MSTCQSYHSLSVTRPGDRQISKLRASSYSIVWHWEKTLLNYLFPFLNVSKCGYKSLVISMLGKKESLPMIEYLMNLFAYTWKQIYQKLICSVTASKKKLNICLIIPQTLWWINSLKIKIWWDFGIPLNRPKLTYSPRKWKTSSFTTKDQSDSKVINDYRCTTVISLIALFTLYVKVGFWKLHHNKD